MATEDLLLQEELGSKFMGDSFEALFNSSLIRFLIGVLIASGGISMWQEQKLSKKRF